MNVSSAGEAGEAGVWLDSKLTICTHINKTCGAAFLYLYNICHMRKFLAKESTEILIHAFITSRFDYCNSLFYGLCNSLILKLLRIQKACAHLVYSVPKFCHIVSI